MTLELLQAQRVAPSILSADFARLGSAVAEVMDAGARVIHVDVMDGHFVPPITMGPLVVSALREQVTAAGGMLDVHLMIERPERHVADFARAGADLITVHAEATPHLHYTVQSIHEAGCGAGVAICPATPVAILSQIAPDLDLALCMTVNPGWGGQAFIEGSVDKVRRLRALLAEGTALEIDGGVEPGTASTCAEAGATVFVAGSAIFGSPDPAAAYQAIAQAAGAPS
ncbi:MAG: ribulose-phosphate 3-epimerase [Solirubrobacteraceae bacterium]|jgi:ribulose-phosphate 3-epimerase|nr:ribulose-phosphate 3-epimerase [Solirubrobacteraceae bacterium]